MSIFEPITKILSLLPNIGIKSSKRIAITLAQEKKITAKLIEELIKIHDKTKKCEICNNLSFSKHCEICRDLNRDENQICILTDITNLFAIEGIRTYQGKYHILENNYILETKDYIENELEKRITYAPQEFILALNPTIEGQATLHYIQRVLSKYPNITVSTLSLGIPMGSELDYLDNGTIAIAFDNRKEL